MNLLQNVSLSDHSTMRLGGQARYATDITSRTELAEALAWAEANNLPVVMVGGGSNVIWQDEGFPGLLLINKIRRYEIFQEAGTNVYVTIGAGEKWDDIVDQTVKGGLTGIEALSLIPGTAGGTPVQNVGAYGQQISDVLTTVEVYDTHIKDFLNIRGADCEFGYRTSRFNATDKGRFFITAITLHLTYGNPQPPFYGTLQHYFEEHDLHSFTPATIRDAVIAIRSSKLPDPATIANTGSFFANPIVSEIKAAELREKFFYMPQWPNDDGSVKIPAAWLVEQAGFKDFHDQDTGMSTWKNQALVLVNEHAKTVSDLLRFKQKIVVAVQEKFGITLEQEPEFLP